MNKPSQILPALGSRALVLGASMAGLLAARVLSERFAEVWLLERDELPEDARPRKGTPHAIHSHGLLAGGLANLETLFPGLTDNLIAKGAVLGDSALDGIFHAGTRRFARGPSSLKTLGVSRLMLECEIRKRVLGLPNVQVRSQVDVTDLAMSEDQATVIGVNLTRRDVQDQVEAQETWHADLVIDATGRASRTPRWLAAHGYSEPEETRVSEGVPVNYVTISMERPLDQPPEALMVLCGSSLEVRQVFVMIAQEPDEQGRGRWTLTFGGYGDDRPPMDIDGLRERSRAHQCPEVTRVLCAQGLLGEPVRYQFAHSQRRHYEKMSRFPARFLVIGDALASLNPVYGQGMTLVSGEALVLKEALVDGLGHSLHARYFARIAELVNAPWETSVTSDLQHDFIPGERTPQIRVSNALVRHITVAAQHDPKIAVAMLNIGHLVAPPESIMKPGMLARILWARLKGDPPTAPLTTLRTSS